MTSSDNDDRDRGLPPAQMSRPGCWPSWPACSTRRPRPRAPWPERALARQAHRQQAAQTQRQAETDRDMQRHRDAQRQRAREVATWREQLRGRDESLDPDDALGLEL